MTPTPEPAPNQTNDGEPKVGDLVEGIGVEWCGREKLHAPVARGRITDFDSDGTVIVTLTEACRGFEVGYTDYALYPDTVRLSSPAPVEAPLVVGAEGLVAGAEYDCVGHPNGSAAGLALRGHLFSATVYCEDTPGAYVAMNVPGRGLVYALLSSLKRIPDAGEGKGDPLDNFVLRPDAYGSHGRPEHDQRIAAMQSAIDAKREKRKAFTLDAFDRPITKPRHPSDWDVDDAEELRVT